MAWRDRTNLYFCPVHKVLALADLDPIATSPTANPMHITQRRNRGMAVPPEMAIQMSLEAALRRAVDSCPLAHLKMMVML